MTALLSTLKTTNPMRHITPARRRQHQSPSTLEKYIVAGACIASAIAVLFAGSWCITWIALEVAKITVR